MGNSFINLDILRLNRSLLYLNHHFAAPLIGPSSVFLTIQGDQKMPCYCFYFIGSIISPSSKLTTELGGKKINVSFSM